MKGDLPAAALRLCAELPVRTHERANISHVHGSKAAPKVEVRGVTYPSLAEAARQLGYSRGKVQLMIQRGKARYA